MLENSLLHLEVTDIQIYLAHMQSIISHSNSCDIQKQFLPL